jgi:hypothetical protein
MGWRCLHERVVARYRDYHIYDAYVALTDLSTIFFSYRLTGIVAAAQSLHSAQILMEFNVTVVTAPEDLCRLGRSSAESSRFSSIKSG